MVLMTILVLPLPLRLRKSSFNVYSKLYDNKEFRTVYSVAGVVVTLLFIDALKSTWKLKTNDTYNLTQYRATYQHSSDVMARIFYAQRNVYISGAVVFFGFAIPTVFTIVRRLIKYEELARAMKDPKQVEAKIVELKDQLSKKTKEVEVFESQKKGLERSYDELADKLNSSETASDKKKD